MISEHRHRVLVADDEEGLRFVLREFLSREGCEVDEAADGAEAVEKARRRGYDLYLLDMKMPKMDGLTALREIRALYPQALSVMITAFGSQSLAVEALKAGAYDYFTKPFNMDELRIILLRALEKQVLLRKILELQQQVAASPAKGRMVGQCQAMLRVFEMIDRVAEHDITVLINGESGTGKELVARAIHAQSSRSQGPFVTVNCAAIPEPLLEGELFGYEKGAFTGAIQTKPGKFEAAGGGTILLDEIGEMPLSLQAKLLRVLQERQVDRIGSNKPREVDIRILTATNRDLAQMVKDGTFREDLYFRINVVPIVLPSLRERREDLPALISFFLSDCSARFGKHITGFTPEAMALMEHHHWPGNIRELENTLQRAVVMATGSMIDPAALPDALRAQAPAGHRRREDYSQPGIRLEVAEEQVDFSVPLATRVETIIEREERRIIEQALKQMNGRRQETADLLGISRKSLHNKMKKYAMGDDEAE